MNIYISMGGKKCIYTFSLWKKNKQTMPTNNVHRKCMANNPIKANRNANIDTFYLNRKKKIILQRNAFQFSLADAGMAFDFWEVFGSTGNEPQFPVAAFVLKLKQSSSKVKTELTGLTVTRCTW